MTNMILTEVNNFNRFPDGRLRAGPFPQDRGRIEQILTRHNLQFGLNMSSGICSRTVNGIMISSSGPDVMGYMIGGDNIEVSSTDLEAFLMDVTDPGVSFTIEGHHCPDEDTMVTSSLSAWRSNGELMVSSRRVLERAGQERRILSHQAPVSVSQVGETDKPWLCLVG